MAFGATASLSGLTHAHLAPVRELKEELRLLQEPGSYVGEVVKLMGKKKILVKVWLAFVARWAGPPASRIPNFTTVCFF